jgi:hypothetical protein
MNYELFMLWRVETGDIVILGVRRENGWEGYHLRTEHTIHDPVWKTFSDSEWCQVQSLPL